MVIVLFSGRPRGSTGNYCTSPSLALYTRTGMNSELQLQELFLEMHEHDMIEHDPGCRNVHVHGEIMISKKQPEVVSLAELFHTIVLLGFCPENSFHVLRSNQGLPFSFYQGDQQSEAARKCKYLPKRGLFICMINNHEIVQACVNQYCETGFLRSVICLDL